MCRLANVVPFAMAHSVLKEVKFHGYRIPTNAVVVPNLDSVLMNPKLFKSPDAFKPERFLSKAGQASCPAHYIPFFFGEWKALGCLPVQWDPSFKASQKIKKKRISAESSLMSSQCPNRSRG